MPATAHPSCTLVIPVYNEEVGYLFDEIKGRPIYLVEEITDNNSNEQ